MLLFAAGNEQPTFAAYEFERRQPNRCLSLPYEPMYQFGETDL